MKTLLIASLFLFVQSLLLGQYNPDAGLIIPFSENATVTTSSGTNKAFITDRNKNSFWESENPLPENYIKRNDLNPFKTQTLYTTTQNINYAVDGDINTKITIKPQPLVIRFKKPHYFHFLSVKYNAGQAVNMIIGFGDDSEKTIVLKPENSYRLQKIPVNKLVRYIKLQCDKPYNLFEIAGLDTAPTEFVLLDFNQPKPVGQLLIRALNDDKVSGIEVLGGNNLASLKKLFTINPTAIPLIPYLLDAQKEMRYVKVVFHLPIRDYYKVKLWELDVYDYYGLYGAPYKARASKQTYGKSFGINAFWGWGYNVYSDRIPQDKGPRAFNKLCTLVRNYHRLDWDIKTPDQTPAYNNMNGANGTATLPRFNWDREYSDWQKAGFAIDAAILFNNNLFPDTLWKIPYREGLNLGKSFTTHFVKNKKLISQIEVGNEPWGYNTATYQQILSGFADGAHQISKVTILPCALQAYDPHPDANNYIKQYLAKSNLHKIDGLNTHIYNYIFDKDGIFTAINPEDPRAEIWSVNNLQRYRNANMPGKDIYVTEFGYDSDGGGETCTHSVCLSEKVQAIYAIRSALILQRLGVKQLYWYYFANVAYNSFLHNRSGLTGSSKTGFKEKKSFYAFKKLFVELKDFRFEKVLSENQYLYAYQFTDDSNNKKIVAWIPTYHNHFKHRWVIIPATADINDAEPVTSDPSVQIKGNRLFLSGVPVVLKIIKKNRR